MRQFYKKPVFQRFCFAVLFIWVFLAGNCAVHRHADKNTDVSSEDWVNWEDLVGEGGQWSKSSGWNCIGDTTDYDTNTTTANP